METITTIINKPFSITNSPTGRIYISPAMQAVYNYILTPSDNDLSLMKIFCSQYVEEVSQAELRHRMSEGSIRTANGIVYTINWIHSVAASLQADKLVLRFRKPLKNVALSPRVLISIGKLGDKPVNNSEQFNVINTFK